MTPDKRRGTAGKQSLNVAAPTKEQQSQPTRGVRQRASATHVLATAVGIVGGTGRFRWAVVYPCPVTTCRRTHLAHVRGDLPAVVERPTACRSGRVALHPVLSRALGGAA